MSYFHLDELSAPHGIDAVIQQYRDRSLLEKFRKDGETQEHAQLVEFVTQALTAHCDKLRGEKNKVDVFLRWFRITRELSHITDLPFNIIGMIEEHVNGIESLRPLPPGDEVELCLNELRALCYSKAPDSNMSLFDIGAMYMDRQQTSQNHTAENEDAQKMKEVREAVIKHGRAEVANWATKYKKYPILAFFCQVFKNKLNKATDQDLAIFTNSWKMPALFKDMPNMKWTVIARGMDTSIQEGRCTAANFQDVSFVPGEELREAVMTITWKLTKLHSVMNGHMDEVKVLKGQIIAAGMTIGITLGNMVVEYAKTRVFQPDEEA